MVPERTVCLSEQEMRLFADASGDLNPVHLDGRIAAASRYEAPVVYGVLGVLAALGALGDRPGLTLRSLDASFKLPLLVGNRYSVQVDEQGPLRASVSIADSALTALTVTVRFARAAATAGGERSERLRAPQEGRTFDGGTSGGYAADLLARGRLENRFSTARRGMSPRAVQALLCVSYLIGMRLPGHGSLMTRLQCAFAASELTRAECERARSGRRERRALCTAPRLGFRAVVVERDVELGEATVSAALDDAGGGVASVTCQTRVSSVGWASDRGAIEQWIQPSERLCGRAAVVVGASRGLGGALALALASQGCEVYACSRTGDGPLASAPGWAGSIERVRGDGGDAEFCRSLWRRIERGHDGVDFLICCAAPRPYAIGLGTYSVGRFNGFIERSIELVTVPMATFLGAVQRRGGVCLYVSSTALTTLPRDWGHYVAAKAAGESLAVWSAKCFPGIEMIIARVPRLTQGRYDPGAENDALPTERVAAELVDRLVESVRPGVHIVEW